MWKKILQSDTELTIVAGDMISQLPLGSSSEFLIGEIKLEYVFAIHTNTDGECSKKYFPFSHLHKDNWWLKMAS